MTDEKSMFMLITYKANNELKETIKRFRKISFDLICTWGQIKHIMMMSEAKGHDNSQVLLSKFHFRILSFATDIMSLETYHLYVGMKCLIECLIG